MIWALVAVAFLLLAVSSLMFGVVIRGTQWLRQRKGAVRRSSPVTFVVTEILSCLMSIFALAAALGSPVTASLFSAAGAVVFTGLGYLATPVVLAWARARRRRRPPDQ